MVPSVAITSPPGLPFTDVAGHDAYDAIQFMFERGFMLGTSPTTFEPDVAFSRAMAATLLYRIAGAPATTFAAVFSDVAAGRWYASAVVWAHENNIVQGVGDGRFAPSVDITREEMATILYHFADFQGRDTTRSADVTLGSQISPWAESAMRWAVYNAFLSDANPRGIMTRAEVATLLMQFIDSGTPPHEDFILTISVEETTLPQGEYFTVHVALTNNSGEDHEIIYSLLFWPNVPLQNAVEVDLPEPQSRFFEAGSVIQDTLRITPDLEPGTHELRFRATFLLNWGQGDHRQIEVWSNTVELTVTEPSPTEFVTVT